jgi:3'-phosphoadenosine 5'-phosphosulfate sulfotransferase (PAPS reductase)/FAD synthetase
MSGVQFEMFPVKRPTREQIIEAALAHNPVAIFAMFSGGDGSLETTHWSVANVPGCEVLHINPGIGIQRTRQFVRDTCERQGWNLTELSAKDDCGQDYEALVRKWGFPGPAGHRLMYNRLKERCVELIVRRRKTKRSDKVMLITGIRNDDSQRRTGYGGREVNFTWRRGAARPAFPVTRSQSNSECRENASAALSPARASWAWFATSTRRPPPISKTWN